LILSSNSFDDVNIEYFSLKYIGQPNFLSTNFLNASKIKTLEIKSTNTFYGFAESSSSLNVQVSNLIIEDCVNLLLTNKTIPSFISLNSLLIRSSGLKQIPDNIWQKFSSLKSLSLIGNQFIEFDSNSLKGLEDRLSYLDLSSNQISNIKWSAFSSFSRVKTINLSYNNLTAINSSSRTWPNSNELDNVILKGYTFDETSICDFYKELNLSRTLVEIDSTHPCNCFVFFIYKYYRLNSGKNLSSLMQYGIPMCYQNLISSGTNLLESKENTCNFTNLLQKTPCASLLPTTASTLPNSSSISTLTTSSSTITTSVISSSKTITTSFITNTTSVSNPSTTTTTPLISVTTSVTTTTLSSTQNSISDSTVSGSSRILTTTPCLSSTTTSPGLTTISMRFTKI
jgi:hypothetical protein